jgi:hypothetical protein
MSAYILIIHGFNDPSKGADNVDLLAEPLEALGHIVERDEADYSWRFLIGTRLFRHSAIARITDAIVAASESGRPVVAIAYSNGASYLFKALNLVFGISVRVILIHPALASRAKVPAALERGWVFITKSDWAVRLSPLVAWLIPGWGAMGVTGYRGDDVRLQNTYDLTDVAKGHGGAFKPYVLRLMVREIQRIIDTK